MGCCKGNDRDKKKKVTDDVTGIKEPLKKDAAQLNKGADLEQEETINASAAETLTKTKKL